MSGENTVSSDEKAVDEVHVLRVELRNERVRLTIECESPEGAMCRLECAEACGADEYPCFSEDEDGTQRAHKLKDSGHCNAELFINEGDIEACNDMDEEPLWDGMPVEVEWDGDGYVWRGAELESPWVARNRARSVAVALEQELARKDQALDEIRALAVAWTDGMGEEIKRSSLSDIDFYAILRAAGMNKAGTEVQRILSDLAAALDAQLNKEN